MVQKTTGGEGSRVKGPRDCGVRRGQWAGQDGGGTENGSQGAGEDPSASEEAKDVSGNREDKTDRTRSERQRSGWKDGAGYGQGQWGRRRWEDRGDGWVGQCPRNMGAT